VRYGFGGYWSPGFSYGGESGEGGGDGGGGESMREGHQGQPYSSEDGVAPSTQMFLNEDDTEDMVEQFIQDTAKRLGIERMPEIQLHDDDGWSEENHSFGMYQPELHVLHVNLRNRHIMDIFRTVAHELAHCRQHEIEQLDDNAGATGSPVENEANAVAGIIMRDFADAHPELFDHKAIAEASGYIPTRAQANDPRFKMALTVDVHPGQTGKEANKMALKTNKQGKPALLMKTANMIGEAAAPKSYGYNSKPLSQVPGEREDDLGNQEATGPEFPPQMPAGTTKVDVSDLTDWYRLGMDISDMDDAKPENYNQGPPQTVIVFPSDEAEQGYLKQFKRLGLKTHDMDPDVEGGEDTTGKHLRNALAEEFELFEEQDLFEINMGSKNLRKEAAKTGAIAGMEFEMIVPNTESSGEDYESEPDYDYDERCRSIDDMYNFFYDGDYNDRRSVERARERMREDYIEWIDEKISEEWESQGEDYVRDWIANNVDKSEWEDDVDDDTTEQEAFDTFAVNVYNDPSSRYYQDAYDEFRDEQQESWDESDWLDDADLDRMSAIEGAYDLNWPHWQHQQSGGEASIEDVANDFEDAIGRSVQASGSYHSGRVTRPSPTAQHYVVEPDGSLEADSDDDQGLEFVSPPLPIDELLSDLNKVKKWAGIYGCYTNDSTGLHINISVPNYSLDQLDYVKLALLLGDEYVLNLFGRSSNTYTKSALGKVRDRVRQNPEDAQQLLDKMKGQMGELASKAIHSGITDKYTSINTKSGHIEFRSPGGDWLDENFDKIENTLLRFTVAMSAALNPEAYREEYQKKLYKLLTQDQKDSDTIRYFSDYVAGKIPKAALRSFVKQAQLERKIKRGEAGDQKMWWEVSNPPQSYASVEVVATSREEAIEKALGPDGYPSWANTRQSVVAKPVRPYEEKPAQQQVGNWGIWIDANSRFANQPGEYARGAEVPLMRFPTREAAEQWLEQQRAERPNMRSDIEVREIEPAEPIPGSTLDLQRQRTGATNNLTPRGPGPWEVANRENNQVYYNTGHTSRAAAEAEARTWLSQNGHNPNDFEVRTRQTAGNADAARGGIVDIAGDDWNADFERSMQQSAQAAQAPRTPTTPGQQQFTGEWKVVDAQGREVYRFGGVGNNQGDANLVAIRWLRDNPRYMVPGVEVLPVMAEGLTESADEYELHDRPKLDRVLAQCCRMVVKGQQRDPERYGQVAACVIDPDNRMIYGINLPAPNGTRRHAERVAIDKYRKSIGEIPAGSIIVTTCSPCNSPMEERYGESCKDLLNSVGIHKVYAGYQDPTQHDDSDADFRVYVTENDQLWGECQLFAQTFLGMEELPENFADGKKSVVDAVQKVLPTAQEIWFHGSRATGKHRKNSDTDILVVVPDDLVGDQYLAVVRILQKLSTQFDNYDIQPTKSGTNIHRIAQEEGQLLWSTTNENFADGRNPQDKGDSKRYGVPTKASVSTLRKVAKQGGRKGQLAHWMANMKAGRAKAKRK
jgi:pyrimidine deaminase RibD-like protein/predicted nucleotidyltransferase